MEYDQGVWGEKRRRPDSWNGAGAFLAENQRQLRDRAATEETNQAETRTHQCEGCRFRGRNVADASLDRRLSQRITNLRSLESEVGIGDLIQVIANHHARQRSKIGRRRV